MVHFYCFIESSSCMQTGTRIFRVKVGDGQRDQIKKTLVDRFSVYGMPTLITGLPRTTLLRPQIWLRQTLALMSFRPIFARSIGISYPAHSTQSKTRTTSFVTRSA